MISLSQGSGLLNWVEHCVLIHSTTFFSFSENCNWWLHEMFLLVVPPIYNHCPSQKANWEITGNRSPPSGLKANLAKENQITFQFCRRGGVHSLLSGRRSRSVSASPPIQKENPFRQELLGEFLTKSSLQDVETSFIAFKMCFFIDIDILNFDTFQKILAVKLNRVLVRN